MTSQIINFLCLETVESSESIFNKLDQLASNLDPWALHNQHVSILT